MESHMSEPLPEHASNNPVMILVGGIMASGKSTIGRLVEEKFSERDMVSHFIDIDEVSKHGQPPEFDLDEDSEVTTQPLVDSPLWNTFIDLYSSHLMTGESGAFVGCFKEWEKRNELMRLAKQAGYSVVGVFFDYKPEDVIGRAVERARSSGNQHLLTEERAEAAIHEWKQHFDTLAHPDLEDNRWMVIRDTSIPPEAIVEKIIQTIEDESKEGEKPKIVDEGHESTTKRERR